MTEETELSTYVEVSVGLPSDILVTLIVEENGYLTVVVLNCVSISVKEVTDTIVTLRTVRSLNLQKIYPISSEPVLVVDNP